MKKSKIAWNLLYPEEDEKKRIPRYYFRHKTDDDMSPVLNLAKRFKSRAWHTVGTKNTRLKVVPMLPD